MAAPLLKAHKQCQPGQHLDTPCCLTLSGCGQTRPAVPCFSRASDIERYDPKSEFALGGDDEGWVATHQDPSAGSAAAAGAGEEDILDLDDDDPEPSASHQGTRAEDDEVPDISELELVEPEDEVKQRARGGGGEDKQLDVLMQSSERDYIG